MLQERLGLRGLLVGELLLFASIAGRGCPAVRGFGLQTLLELRLALHYRGKFGFVALLLLVVFVLPSRQAGHNGRDFTRCRLAYDGVGLHAFGVTGRGFGEKRPDFLYLAPELAGHQVEALRVEYLGRAPLVKLEPLARVKRRAELFRAQAVVYIDVAEAITERQRPRAVGAAGHVGFDVGSAAGDVDRAARYVNVNIAARVVAAMAAALVVGVNGLSQGKN